jgi:hypothetical protein
MGAVLPGDAGDEGHLVGPPNHYCLRARPRGKFVCRIPSRGADRAKSLMNAGAPASWERYKLELRRQAVRQITGRWV